MPKLSKKQIKPRRKPGVRAKQSTGRAGKTKPSTPSQPKPPEEQTFAEVYDQVPFDWNKALNAKRITSATWKELAWRAKGWVTCACGNQCAILPRASTGAPIDPVLRILGVRFSDKVAAKQQVSALLILESIETRASYLLAAMKLQPTNEKFSQLANARQALWDEYLKANQQLETYTKTVRDPVVATVTNLSGHKINQVSHWDIETTERLMHVVTEDSRRHGILSIDERLG